MTSHASRRWRLLWLVAAAAVGLSGASAQAQSTDSAEAQLTEEVGLYLQSIDEGDARLGAKVFHMAEDTTFIHPRGTERGWADIEKDIYGFFGSTFSKRSLKRVGDLHIHVYGDSAVVDFQWDFNATFRANAAPLHSSGRESQIFHKFPGLGWRIVHVHYSGLPVTGQGRGF